MSRKNNRKPFRRFRQNAGTLTHFPFAEPLGRINRARYQAEQDVRLFLQRAEAAERRGDAAWSERWFERAAELEQQLAGA